MSTTAEKKALQAELAAQGYSLKITQWPTKVTYYKADGEIVPNLPADPYSMRNYMARGFSPVPPKKPIPTVAIPETMTATMAPVVPEATVEKVRVKPKRAYKARARSRKPKAVKAAEKETSDVLP